MKVRLWHCRGSAAYQERIRPQVQRILGMSHGARTRVALAIAEAAKLLAGAEETELAIQLCCEAGDLRVVLRARCEHEAFPAQAVYRRFKWLGEEKRSAAEALSRDPLLRSLWRMLLPAEYVVLEETGRKIILLFQSPFAVDESDWNIDVLSERLLLERDAVAR
ncbi:hypothetical protein [Mitsuokella sp. oral taxon 131]|uniref:hypothetical protein n=1 Tax=Mitsuokella sp. oral taxon 131 TaxID=1321780 RepID=UPI000429B0E5|nr:hypothetical protein [Mitsuokella sp. oral taxon 131]